MRPGEKKLLLWCFAVVVVIVVHHCKIEDTHCRVLCHNLIFLLLFFSYSTQMFGVLHIKMK